MSSDGKPSYLQDAGTVILGSEVYIIHDDCVLLHKRSDIKKTFPGYWIGPGGHIDTEEDALTTAIREVKEETGVIISPKQLQLKSVAFHRHRDRKELYVLYIFRAVITERPDQLPTTREGISAWIPLVNLGQMENIFPASRYYFEHVVHGAPGILYTNLILEQSNIVTVSSHVVNEA